MPNKRLTLTLNLTLCNNCIFHTHVKMHMLYVLEYLCTNEHFCEIVEMRNKWRK